MEWKPGLILRIKDYKFEDDGSIRDKYSIVLSINNNQAYLLHSLTTSQNKLDLAQNNFGCSVQNGIPYYFIPKNHSIGDQNYFFDFDTFIFFKANIRKTSYSQLEEASKKLFGITVLGVLSNEELKRIIKCALKSRFITQEIAAELSAFKESL